MLGPEQSPSVRICVFSRLWIAKLAALNRKEIPLFAKPTSWRKKNLVLQAWTGFEFGIRYTGRCGREPTVTFNRSRLRSLENDTTRLTCGSKVPHTGPGDFVYSIEFSNDWLCQMFRVRTPSWAGRTITFDVVSHCGETRVGILRSRTTGRCRLAAANWPWAIGRREIWPLRQLVAQTI